MQILHEWLYFLNENEKNNIDIIVGITALLRRRGKPAVRNKERGRIRVRIGEGAGVQLIIYTDVLKTYRILNDNTSTRWEYAEIKKLCKIYPPTKLAISISYMSDNYTPADKELRKFIVQIMQRYLGDTLREDYVRRTIPCPSH